MNFFRKYQRILLMVVSVMTIASFSFFGTFSAFAPSEKIVDQEIGRAIDGSPIMERDVKGMIRFLSLGGTNVIEKDLIVTGMASILAEQYFDNIREEFEARLQKVKTYKPYTHPQLPFLSAEEIWKQFIPELSIHLGELKKKLGSPQTFNLYCRLYLDQIAFPPHLLKRVLSYKQQQFEWVQPDPLMTESRLALFGFKSLEDWFGQAFMKHVSCFLINAALMAQQKGYEISTDEARADLFQNALYTLRSQTQQQDRSYQDAQEFLHHQLRVSGVEEATAIKIWKRVMLFRRMFEDVSQSVFLDSLTYQQFGAYAGERALIELYQLPQSLRLKNFQALLKFQFYPDAVSPKNRSDFSRLPRHFLSSTELEKRVPELVVSRFHLEVAKVSKDEIAQRITLKETWEFEMSDAGWTILNQEFPILGKKEEMNRQDRFQRLEALDPEFRLKVDRFARTQIVTAHPEWIEEVFQKAVSEKIQVAIRSQGPTDPFVDIDNPEALLKSLSAAPVGESLPLFTSSEDVFYKITVLEKPSGKEVMTYQEADSFLDQLLDKQLEDGYVVIREKNPELFQLKNGSWKPFHEVKDQVGARVFSDVLKKMNEESLSLNHYSSHRLASFMQAAEKDIREKGDESPYLKPSGDPLKDQWLLVKNTTTVKRSDSVGLPKEEMFMAKEGDWSSISTPLNGDLAFFRVLSLQGNEDPMTDQLAEGQGILSMDAKRFLMHKILEQIDLK